MRVASRIGAVGALAAVVCAVGVALAASPPVAYCSLPSGPKHPGWGFHTGAPIQTAPGSYARGRGTFSGQHATGEICQVDRPRTGPDRQIILKVARGPVVSRHAVSEGGVLGNLLKLPVRVVSSNDSLCHVGARGTFTAFASFNGIRKDFVKFSFGKSCRRHGHRYGGPTVVVRVPHGS